jgi:hypothetical protein
MDTGEVEANLRILNQNAKLSYVDELIERKLTGAEQGVLDAADVSFYRKEYDRLTLELETRHAASKLPEIPIGSAALNDLLVRLRLGENSTR